MKKFFILNILFIIALVLCNIDELNAADGDDEGWRDNVFISAGLEWYKGTTNLINYYYSFSYIASLKDQWDVDYGIEGNYAETEGEKSINEHIMKLTFDRWFLGGNIAVDYLGSIETNQIQNIYSREVVGVGPKFRPLHLWWIEFYLLTLPILDHTRTYDLLESEIIYRQQNEAGLTIFFSEDESKSLVVKYAYIPNLQDYKDYRTELSSVLTLNIIDIFYILITFKQTYVSQPYETEEFDVKKTNYSTIVSLGVEF